MNLALLSTRTVSSIIPHLYPHLYLRFTTPPTLFPLHTTPTAGRMMDTEEFNDKRCYYNADAVIYGWKKQRGEA